jgi:hypothetical protein
LKATLRQDDRLVRPVSVEDVAIADPLLRS